jgi:hypothetical protein
VTAYLLDVNVLLALFWPAHEFHRTAQRWFESIGESRWATTPITQIGFVRNASNPVVSRDATRPRDAVTLLEGNLRHPRHVFWAGNLGVDALRGAFDSPYAGYRQVTDAWLVALAAHERGKLATFDRGIPELVGDRARREALVELIPR